MPTAGMQRNVTGFTLLELLIVVAIIAVGTVGVGLALPDSAEASLKSQAHALAALLETARSQSRASGVPVRWRPSPEGFSWEGLDATGPDALPTTWKNNAFQVTAEVAVLLGPEPLIPAQSIRLWLKDHPSLVVTVATDGLRPFTVVNPGADK